MTEAPFRNARFASDRLDMRPLTIDDADWLFEGYGDADLMRWWSSAPHATVEETRAYLAPRVTKSDWRGWAMVDRATGTPIGTLAAGEKRPGVAEIGYLLVRRHWGAGYAREAVARLVEVLFDEGHRRIMADTDPDNAASNALLTRLGFTCEGRLRAEWETHIAVRDSFIWGLLRAEWPR